MNVVIINGSNRPNGYGVRLAKAAAEGFDSENETEIIQPMKADIKACTGCCRCMVHEPRESIFDCPVRDDSHEIIQKMTGVDFLIVNSPVYLDHVPGPFKMLLDRVAKLAYIRGLKRPPRPRLKVDERKAYASICTYAAPTWIYLFMFNLGRKLLKPLGKFLGRKWRFHMNFSETKLDGRKLPEWALEKARRMGQKARARLDAVE